MKNSKILIIVVITFAAGIFISPFIFHKTEAKEEKQETKTEAENGTVKVTKTSQELLNLETAEVKKAPLTEKIPVTGQIAQDVEQTNTVIAPMAGIVIENTAELGAIVKKGDVISRIKPNDQDAIIDVKSPYEGVIIGDFDKKGEKVETVSSLCTIANLSQVWANFDIYEKDMAKIKVGQKVSVYSIAYPDENIEGKIVFISPRVDDTTRTIKIRATIDNPKYLLKLGMFINADVLFVGTEEYLIVPLSALQTLGDKTIVFVKAENEEFHKQEVKVRSQTNDQAAISEGLKVGDRVVTQGSFLLKSGLLKDELEGE